MKGIIRLTSLPRNEVKEGSKIILYTDVPPVLAICTVHAAFPFDGGKQFVIEYYSGEFTGFDEDKHPLDKNGNIIKILQIPLKQSDWTKVIKLELIDREVEFNKQYIDCEGKIVPANRIQDGGSWQATIIDKYVPIMYTEQETFKLVQNAIIRGMGNITWREYWDKIKKKQY